MKKELSLLHLLAALVALALVVFVIWNALTSPDFFSIDNLFITVVFLVLAVMFAASLLLQLHAEGKLPIPFTHRASKQQAQMTTTASGVQVPALLDSKGRAVPPDVRNMVGRFTPAERKDA